MFIAILTLLSALSISAVAIYYSIAGLAAIFAGAAIPIMIMGSVLEVGKLITASWLYQYWKVAPRFLKYYLSIAVIVLMFITSMGIFGYLSKAHVEQTSQATGQIQEITRIENEVERLEGIITRAEQKIDKAEQSTSNNDSQIQEQIDKEQIRIDSAYTRIQPAIDEQLAIIEAEENKAKDKTKPYENELEKIDQDLRNIELYLANDQIKELQAMVGVNPDGRFGWRTRNAVTEYKDKISARRLELLTKIEEIRSETSSDTIIAARNEITRLRQFAEQEIANANELISRLRQQLGKDNSAEIDAIVDEQNAKIKTASDEIEILIDKKYDIQGEYQKLEAEVGPLKYIAEFVYGQEADQDLLEAAVRWVIITIIFVFDPLAVLLLIAANFTFKHRYGRSFEEMIGVPGPSGGPGGVTPDSYWKERYEDMQSQLDEFNKLKEQEDEGKEQEDLRAQKIVDNPGVDIENQTNPYTVSNVSVNYGEHPVTSDYNLLTAGYSLAEIEEQRQKEQEEKFKQREAEEKKKLEEIAQKAREEIIEEVYPMPEENTTEDKQEDSPPDWETEEVKITDLSDPDLKKKT